MRSGDSLSSVGYTSKDPPPSPANPIGLPYPGITSCEQVNDTTGEVTFAPNWVGHLSDAVNAQRRARARDADPPPPLLVYDYAVPGDTAARMHSWQVRREFAPRVGQRPAWAPWTPDSALFVTWIGTNDCAWNVRLRVASAQAGAGVEDVFRAQEALYGAGARNFCLVDLPPCHLFPKGPKGPAAASAYEDWNAMLAEQARTFSAAHVDATVVIFSSWKVISDVLMDTQLEMASREAMFVDGFHPSPQMHQVLARQMYEFLLSVPSSPAA